MLLLAMTSFVVCVLFSRNCRLILIIAAHIAVCLLVHILPRCYSDQRSFEMLTSPSGDEGSQLNSEVREGRVRNQRSTAGLSWAFLGFWSTYYLKLLHMLEASEDDTGISFVFTRLHAQLLPKRKP